MIVFDLICGSGHQFEGWFRSSADFSSQGERGLLSCPECGSSEVIKAPMAPAVPVKGNRSSPPMGKATQDPSADEGASEKGAVSVSNNSAGLPMPEAVTQAFQKLAELQAAALKDSKWVGKDFAEKSRAMHYGEEETASIHGEATPEQAQDLLDEGVSVSPLPFPVAPPKDLN